VSSIRVARFTAFCALLLLASGGRATAQNLFEVQVFPDEILERGETQVEFHSVLMPSGTRLPDRMLDRSSHVHLSFELSHGWNDTFETGVFLETSPSTDDNHAALTGFHFRPKFRFAEWRRFPFHTSVAFEYAFIKQPGDVDFRQALGITPIFERHVGAFEMSFNPGVEVEIHGSRGDGSPVFEPSAKLASRISQTAWIGVEYYAETGPIKHFDPLAEQHHLVFPSIDIRSRSGWNLNLGVGRGLTGSSEHWVVKTIVGLPLRNSGRPQP